MAEMIVTTSSLSYWAGKQQILHDVSLEVPRGAIYGFLGSNGAGKTTTIKILLSLLKVPLQKVFLFGKELSEHRKGILHRVGSLVEQPALYGHLTGKENLRNRALLLQVSNKKIDEVLAVVGLEEAANKKAGHYSLGMKQRLGIALALLHDPELLILDEPTNGLDPKGIMELRELLHRLAAERGKTIFISSHLLSEVEKIATHVGIINKGRLLFQGSIGELYRMNRPYVNLRVGDLVGAANLLLNKGYAADIENDAVIVPYSSDEEMAALNALLVERGYIVYSVRTEKKDLEHLFLNITQN